MTRDDFPAAIPPMLAVPGSIDDVGGPGWAYEMKWDGVRTITYVHNGQIKLRSRNDLDVTSTYPELHALGGALERGILDGEVVALDAKGRPSFGRLQQRMGLSRPGQVDLARREVPVAYLIFDVLSLDGTSTMTLPYAERRSLLGGLALTGDAWAVPPSSDSDATAMLAASLDRGLEGIVAKRVDSAYVPGRRSPLWRKIKNIRTQEVVVAGWRPGNGRRSEGIGALLLGVLDAAGLRYVGRVGTGFSERALADLGTRLAPLTRATPPFVEPIPRADARDARWVAPELVGEVAFTEWTTDGRLRHPVWRGLRHDKDPNDVHPE